jgi:hypothetical protein
LPGITLFAGNHTTLVALAFAKNEVRRALHVFLAVSLSPRLVMSIIGGSCEQMSLLLPVADALTRPGSGSTLKSPMAGTHDGCCRSRSTRIRRGSCVMRLARRRLAIPDRDQDGA